MEIYVVVLLFWMSQEKLQEREQHILELERKLEEKERELHTIKLDNEAVRFMLL